LYLSHGLKEGLKKIFSKEDFSSIGSSSYEYIKLFVGKVINSKTRGSCIPTDSVKSGDDYPILIHYTGIGAYIDSDKTNLAYLVDLSYVMPGW